MEITIATWNIGGGKPLKNKESFSYKDEDYLDEDVSYFGSKIKELNPDIICLQETHIGLDKSLAKEIAEVAGDYQVVEKALSESHIDSRYKLGNAILSKNKSVEDTFFYFPYPSFPLARRDGGVTVVHEKGSQALKFEFGTVANLHMQPLAFLGTKYDSPNGMIYAKEVEKTLEQNLTNPIVLCGDFNYVKSDELYAELINKLSLKGILPDQPTRPDNKKTDYIFVSPEFTIIDSGIIETNSDHYLCWAKLKV